MIACDIRCTLLVHWLSEYCHFHASDAPLYLKDYIYHFVQSIERPEEQRITELKRHIG
jgi:hypothetical protein